jgi:GrpB-like predicted nucleotidyltransferase (UPF0157 family)
VNAEEPWVEVFQHDGRWAESYRAEAAAIRAALGDYVAGIEHFGSTAVPGLIAKPIVDILIARSPEANRMQQLSAWLVSDTSTWAKMVDAQGDTSGAREVSPISM